LKVKGRDKNLQIPEKIKRCHTHFFEDPRDIQKKIKRCQKNFRDSRKGSRRGTRGIIGDSRDT